MPNLDILFRRALNWVRLEVLVLPSRILVVLFFLGMMSLPLVVEDPYILRVMILTCIFAIYVASWDLLSGYTGQVNFGHAFFFGIGAYTSALLNYHLGYTPWLTIPLGAVCAMGMGYLIGIPCLRLRGSYLSLATLAFPLILLGIFFALPDIFGGELGISGIRSLVRSRVANYYIAVISMFVLVGIMWKIGDSKLGLILHAIREDEVAARASGINTTYHKLLAFALSGLFAGFAGGLYAHFIRITGPSTLAVSFSFQAVIWGIFGGVATIYGPVVGVFILYPLTEIMGMWESVSEYRLLAFAVVVLLVLLYMPEGFSPWFRDKVETECPRCKERNFFRRTECRICQAELSD